MRGDARPAAIPPADHQDSPPPPPVARFDVQILGPLAIARDGVALQPVRWQRWVASLFLLLVTAPERRRSRDDVIDALWPEATPLAGASDFRYIVHLLRRNLGGGDPLPVLSERGWVGLSPAYEWRVDHERFEALLAVAGDIEHYERAAALVRGEALLDVRYEDWSRPLRDRLRQQWRTLCLRLGQLHQEAGSAEAALRWLDRALEDDPLDEQVVVEALRVLLDAGRVPEAVRRYRRYAERLGAELGTTPGPALTALVAPFMSPPPAAAPLAILPADPRVMKAAAPATVVPSYPLPLEGALVAHRDALAAVEAALAAASEEAAECQQGQERQRPRLILVAGEAGVGKTRVLAEVARHAGAQGVLLLAGGCYEQEGRVPYGPFHDALHDYVGAQPGALLRSQLGDLLSDLVKIVPELRGRAGVSGEMPREDGADQRLQLFAAVAQTLERLAEPRPLVLLLDDLQWVDRASAQLLHYLVRQRQLGRVLFVGAYRDDEPAPGAPLATLLTELEQSRPTGELIAVVTLARLDRAQIGALVCDRLGAPCAAELAEAIYQTSAGNPFCALQILALLREEGRLELQPADGAGTGAGVWRLLGDAQAVDLPPSVRQIVARRLRGLGPRERRLLQIGAVLGMGREFGQQALCALWTWDRNRRQNDWHRQAEAALDSLWDALDNLLAARLLQETRTGFAFPQPLLWMVVYREMPAHRRRQLHRQAGLTLEDLYRDHTVEHAAELAHHFLEAGERQRALRYATDAAAWAEAASTPDEAARCYRLAFDLASNPAREPDTAVERRLRVDLLLKLGRVERMAGRCQEARSRLEQAARLCDGLDDPLLECLVWVNLAKTYYRLALRDEMTHALGRAEALQQEAGSRDASRDLALLYLELGTLNFLRGEYQLALAARERAVQVAGALADERLRVRAEATRIVALAMLGHMGDAGAAAGSLIPRAEAAGDRDALRLALAQCAEAAMLAGDFARSQTYRDRELEVATRLGVPGLLLFTLSNLAQLNLYGGRWAAAQQYAEQALEIARASEHPARSAYPLAIRGELALRRGGRRAAARDLGDSACISERSGDVQALRSAQRLLAECDVLDGHHERAMRRLTPLLDRPGLVEHDVTALLPALGAASLASGDVARAEQFVADAMTRAEAQGNRLALQAALRVRGLVLAEQSQVGAAERSLVEAIRMAHAMPYPFAEAQAWSALGAIQRRGDRIDQARASLRRALALFQRLGAVRDVRETQRALADLDGALRASGVEA